MQCMWKGKSYGRRNFIVVSVKVHIIVVPSVKNMIGKMVIKKIVNVCIN